MLFEWTRNRVSRQLEQFSFHFLVREFRKVLSFSRSCRFYDGDIMKLTSNCARSSELITVAPMSPKVNTGNRFSLNDWENERVIEMSMRDGLE